jgi:hypothetical protein
MYLLSPNLLYYSVIPIKEIVAEYQLHANRYAILKCNDTHDEKCW